MTENKKENIDNLLSRFYPTEQAEQIKNDLTETDRLFEKFPAPQVSQKVIDEIKLKIIRKQTRLVFSTVLVKTAAVAAIVIIGAVLLLQNITPQKPTGHTQNGYEAALWQTDSNGTDPSIASLEKEIELLKGEIVAIRLNEDNGTNEQLADSINNVDTEITEIENYFWKG
jgi:hypothetical protein